jgi:hypothetical protein
LLNNATGMSVNMGNGANTLNLAAGTNVLGDVFGLNFINGGATEDVLTMQGSFNNTIDLNAGTDTLNFSQTASNVTVVNVENVTALPTLTP